jgi:adenylyltransferase/sulfurtransferase
MAAQEPLVAPDPPLPPERLARYSRQLALTGFDETAQRRLAAARVLVVGAGGLGSATVPYLAAAGIGTIGIVDTDVVELSNLHRQIAHGVADLGRRKLDSLAEEVARIDPQTRVILHDVRLNSTTMPGILDGYDLVVDGSDNFPTRYLANDAAALAGKPLVWGAILQYGGQASVAWIGHGPTYRDLFPVPPAPDTVLSCELGGVLPSVCAVIGAILSAETLKIVTGIGEPLLGRLTTYDALTGRFRELDYEHDETAAEVTELIDYEAFCGLGDGRDGSAGRKGSEMRSAAPDAEEIEPRELAELLRSGAPLQLIDIREPYERAIVSIDGSELIPLGSLPSSLDRIRTDLPVVLFCHHAVRSERALHYLRDLGFDNVRHLAGGIDEYAALIEPALARY